MLLWTLRTLFRSSIVTPDMWQKTVFRHPSLMEKLFFSMGLTISDTELELGRDYVVRMLPLLADGRS